MDLWVNIKTGVRGAGIIIRIHSKRCRTKRDPSTTLDEGGTRILRDSTIELANMPLQDGLHGMQKALVLRKGCKQTGNERISTTYLLVYGGTCGRVCTGWDDAEYGGPSKWKSR